MLQMGRPLVPAMLILGELPQNPPVRCDRQRGRQTSSVDLSTEVLPVPPPSTAKFVTARAVLVERQRVIEAKLLTKRFDKAVA
jgi:hypothetical protein